jgi:hypothetical protein
MPISLPAANIAENYPKQEYHCQLPQYLLDKAYKSHSIRNTGQGEYQAQAGYQGKQPDVSFRE